MKNFFRCIIPFLLASFACSLAAEGGSTGQQDNRPIIQAGRPAVVFLAPQTGEKYALGTEVLLYAEARDQDAGIVRIEFYDNFDELIGGIDAPNPQSTMTAILPWQPPSAQTHFVKAKALRADGTESNQVEVSIQVVESASVQAPPPQPTPAQESSTLQTTSTEESIPVEPTVQQPDTSANTPVQATVNAEALNVRVAPGVRADIARAPLTSGQTIELVGRSEDGLWFATPLDNGGTGWVFGDPLQIQGDPSTLPLITVQ